MTVKLNEAGAPVNPSLPIFRIDGKCASPTRVKDHPVWAREQKPWGNYIHPSNRMHSSIECHYFYRTALLGKGGNYVSLGAFRGLSTACFAYGLSEGSHTGKVYGVDLFNHVGEPGEQLEAFNAGIKAANLEAYVEACDGYTHVWAEKLRDKKFKFILIDADHHYETCKQDYEVWSPLLEKDGLLAFHDVDMATVDKVIEEIAPQWRMVDHYHRLKVFTRR